MATLRLADRDTEDRGYDIPAQTYLLGPVQQVGLKLVKAVPQIAEDSQAGPDIQRVCWPPCVAADRADDRAHGPDIIRRAGQ